MGALLDATDQVVPIGGDGSAVPRSRGVWTGSDLQPWNALRSARVGLLGSVARPERVVRMLERHGVVPRVTHLRADHAHAGPAVVKRCARLAREEGLDLWLATAKCAAGLIGIRARGHLDFPLGVIDYELSLSPELARRVGAVLDLGDAQE
jgi:hypothetical protein